MIDEFTDVFSYVLYFQDTHNCNDYFDLINLRLRDNIAMRYKWIDYSIDTFRGD